MKSSDGSLDPEQEAAAHSAEDAHEEHDTEDIDNAEDEDTEEECPSPVGAKRKRDSKESSSGIDEDESHKPLPAFITKTFNMINEESHFDVISWNPKGDGFVVKNEHEFAQNILPKYFKHRNFSSFVRQLNLYGFHKYAHDSLKIEFKHVSFRKGRLDLLHLIKRKPGASSNISKKSKAVIDDLNQQIKELKTKYEQMWKVQQQMMVFLSTFLKEYSHLNGSPTQLAIGDNVNGSSTSSNRQQIAQYPANADSFPPESSQVLPEISNHNFQQIKKLLDQSSSFGNQIANPRPSINPTLLVGFNDTLQNQDHSGLSAESKSASSVQLFSHQGNLPKHSSSFLSRLPSVQLASSPAFSSYGAIPSSSSLPSLSSQGAPSIAMASIHEVDTLSAPVSRMIEFPNGYSAASDLSQSKSVLDSPTFSRNSRGFLNSPVGPMQNQSLSSSPQFASLPSPMRRSSARLDSLSPIGRLTNSPLMDDDLRDEPLPASPFGMGSNEALDMLNPDEFL